jgi:hypothetical protein
MPLDLILQPKPEPNRHVQNELAGRSGNVLYWSAAGSFQLGEPFQCGFSRLS